MEDPTLKARGPVQAVRKLGEYVLAWRFLPRAVNQTKERVDTLLALLQERQWDSIRSAPQPAPTIDSSTPAAADFTRLSVQEIQIQMDQRFAEGLPT